MLTPSLKLKRRKVVEVYGPPIEALYAKRAAKGRRRAAADGTATALVGGSPRRRGVSSSARSRSPTMRPRSSTAWRAATTGSACAMALR